MVRTSGGHSYFFLLVLVVVEATASLLLTARILDGTKAVIHSLSAQSATKSLAWLPSLQDAQHANIVQLREIDTNGVPLIVPNSGSQEISDNGKQRNWLTLLVRESLGIITTYAPLIAITELIGQWPSSMCCLHKSYEFSTRAESVCFLLSLCPRKRNAGGIKLLISQTALARLNSAISPHST
jgi:hypothetical protein